MFSLRDFIKKGLIDSIGKEPNYKIILNTASWIDKGVLQQSDAEEINAMIEELAESEDPVDDN